MGNEHVAIFNFIAPFYGIFFNYQVRYYEKIIARVSAICELAQYNNVIDVGCGTGALCYVLNEKGLKVTGIDAAQKMIEIASHKLRDSNIVLHNASALGRIPYADKHFDVAIASYVFHGLNKEERQEAYAEMSRVARHKVIIHDYNDKRAWLTNLVEWMEGGEYFDFIQNVQQEIADNFCGLQIVEVDTRASWYICTPI